MRRGCCSCFAVWVGWGGAGASCTVGRWLARSMLRLQRRVGSKASGAHSPGRRRVFTHPYRVSHVISISLSYVLPLTLNAISASSKRAQVFVLLVYERKKK
uniref:Putative secreted protein n=1 Tax=Ixodes ricinus TaxID=34613 RepID=A0A6B0U6J9_IXORI